MVRKTLAVHNIPKSQALSSNTFKAPPLDGSLTIPEIYDWHLTNTPSHPLFIYADEFKQINTLFWPEVVRAVHEAARCVRSMVSPSEDTSIAPHSPLVVGIVSAAGGIYSLPYLMSSHAGLDTITYFTTMIGIVRAGHTAFPISPRNSPAAIAHLVKTAKVSHLVVGQEKNFQALVEASVALMDGEKPKQHIIPRFDELYLPNSAESFVPLSFRKPGHDEVGIILHSSGSTAFPKPIPWTHYQLMHIAIFPCKILLASNVNELYG